MTPTAIGAVLAFVGAVLALGWAAMSTDRKGPDPFVVSVFVVFVLVQVLLFLLGLDAP